MNWKASLLVAPLVLLAACGPDSATPTAPLTDVSAQLSRSAAGGRPTAGVVYVRTQGLYYDTFVSAETLPRKGRFQLLENGETDYGPGQPGYLGGRWWVDNNGNGVQDDDDSFLLCPLLPPGRLAP